MADDLSHKNRIVSTHIS